MSATALRPSAPPGAVTPPRAFAREVAPGVLRLCVTPDRPPTASPIVVPGVTELPLEPLNAAGAAVGSFRLEAPAPGRPGLDIYWGTAAEPLVRLTGWALEPRPLVRHYCLDDPPSLSAVDTVDGRRVAVDNLVPVVVGSACRATVDFAPAPAEGLYGLGQDEDGGYNRRGTRYYLYQHNRRTPLPCLVSDRGWGLLADCGSLAVFDDTGDGTRLELDAVPALDLYIVAGGVAAAARGFRRLTGGAPLLPKWAFGYLQSKERYESAAELVEVAAHYRRLGLPLDGVIQDWKTWPDDEWGQKTPDPARYPDLPGLKAALHALDVHALVAIWPTMALGTADHAEFADAGLLLPDHSTYDAFDPRARDLYWEQLATLNQGFDGWWSDATEPFTMSDWCGPVRRPEAERFGLVGGEHVRYLGADRANLYSLIHAQGLYEHERAAQREGAPARRVLNLSRSGYPGCQRYGAVLWSGDVTATWPSLRAEVAKACSLALAGMPWWTTDAGGFFAGGAASWRRWAGDAGAEPVWFWQGNYDGGVADPGFRELYTRWLQFACFLPLCRSHGTDTPREAWRFGAPGEPYYDAIAATLSLRYRLLPYIYTAAATAALDDETMVRPLLAAFPDDPAARGVADEFLLGDALLVAPVTAPFYSQPGQAGVQERQVYLPAGADWTDFWTGVRHPGGQAATVAAPLDRPPLFVRAGSVLPLQGPVSHALANRDRFELAVYPGADGGGRLYDDDGVTYDYEQGEFTVVRCAWTDATRHLSLWAERWRRDAPMAFTIRTPDTTRALDFSGGNAELDL
ncbi:MAG: DUF5110 domain-containing protein [Propionibacteriaceae bacterium]|jgi:alpha-D-xyloside xylohydrolase|nr:DUF5110 domain-containing protein [Propionibacteriaceae bacterium]